MRVLPGYQRMSERQRAVLLSLGERGELGRSVRVRELAGGTWRASDGQSTFLIHADGEHDRIAVP